MCSTKSVYVEERSMTAMSCFWRFRDCIWLLLKPTGLRHYFEFENPGLLFSVRNMTTYSILFYFTASWLSLVNVNVVEIPTPKEKLNPGHMWTQSSDRIPEVNKSMSRCVSVELSMNPSIKLTLPSRKDARQKASEIS